MYNYNYSTWNAVVLANPRDTLQQSCDANESAWDISPV